LGKRWPWEGVKRDWVKLAVKGGGGGSSHSVKKKGEEGGRIGTEKGEASAVDTSAGTFKRGIGKNVCGPQRQKVSMT